MNTTRLSSTFPKSSGCVTTVNINHNLSFLSFHTVPLFSMGSLSFVMDSVVDSPVILQAGNVRRSSFPLYKAAGTLSFCRGCRTARKLVIKRVNATSTGSGDSENVDDSEDALQATIEKSKKVLEMQRNLLDQIKERKKLVSSMKSSIINHEDEEEEEEEEDVSIASVQPTANEVKKNSPIGGGDVIVPSARQLNDINEETVESKDEGSAQLETRTNSYSNTSLNLGANKKLNDAPGKKIQSDVSFSMFEYNASLPLRDENRERVVEESSPQIVTAKEDSKPPPLAGVNVMNIIMVAAECAPFVKTGGLADVAGALPKALARRGHRVMVVVPRYNVYANAQDTGVRKMYRVDGQDMEVNYFQTFIDGVDFVFIDAPIFRHIENNIYGGKREDILKRMVLFCKAAVEVPWHVPCGGICYGDGNLVFIANDWHTALLPVYLKAYYRDHGLMQYTRSVLVIHNMAHQGRGPVSDFSFTDLPPHYLDLFKFYDPLGGEHFNIFAAGIKMADRIVTVSHGYAWEVKTPEGGWGLHGVINENDWKLTGIVNGIDTDDWHPEVDIHLQSDGYSNYSLDTLKTGKPRCKKALQKELSLPVRENVPLIGFIGRLDDQKGVDLIAEAVPWMMDQDVQLVMLGTGRADLEQMLRHFEGRYNDRVRGWVGFSVKTAHRITAGADILLMPSRFEPCGLNQLYAMSYGTVPVVHAVGGLRDTVQPFNPYEESGLGWTFDRADVSQLIHALGNCLYTYREYKNSWEGIQRRGMMQNLSWDTAAEKYEEVLVAAKYQW